MNPNTPKVPNPIIENLADSGILRHRGWYMAIGTYSNGAAYFSHDLLEWSRPRAVFSMQNIWATGPAGQDSEIHACDLQYINGLYHLYWSVNYKELRQIGHARSEKMVGPYEEPILDRPLDGRIDPHIFMDEDGALYFYTVKFPDGNVIYGQEMSAPDKLKGEAKVLLTPLPDTWEKLDPDNIKVNEAQCVCRYRDLYYMLYNANHTSDLYGNYGIGCAVAEEPLAFSNAGKYPEPVLKWNKQRVRKNAAERCEDWIANCGQPSLTRGPNGFEWWVMYFAIYNSSRHRHQAIDRVYFFNRRLWIDGPTNATTPGCHPPPAAPSFQSWFIDGLEEEGLPEEWHALSGRWNRNRHGAYQERAKGEVLALARMEPARHYVIEATLRADGKKGRMGLVVSRDSAGGELRVFIEPGKNCWGRQYRGETMEEETYSLPPGFRCDVFHTFRVEKNGRNIALWLDQWAAPECHRWNIPSAELSVPVIFGQDMPLSCAWFQCTRGWDEYDEHIAGWGDGLVESSSGHWQTDKQGLSQTEAEGVCRIFKHDAWGPAREGMVNLEWDAAVEKGALGFYPYWQNEENWLQMEVETATGKVTAQGRKDDLPVGPWTATVEVKGSLFLRFMSDGDQVYLFADVEQLFALENLWADGEIALFTRNQAGRFNGITCFERGEARNYPE